MKNIKICVHYSLGHTKHSFKFNSVQTRQQETIKAWYYMRMMQKRYFKSSRSCRIIEIETNTNLKSKIKDFQSFPIILC